MSSESWPLIAEESLRATGSFTSAIRIEPFPVSLIVFQSSTTRSRARQIVVGKAGWGATSPAFHGSNVCSGIPDADDDKLGICAHLDSVRQRDTDRGILLG